MDPGGADPAGPDQDNAGENNANDNNADRNSRPVQRRPNQGGKVHAAQRRPGNLRHDPRPGQASRAASAPPWRWPCCCPSRRARTPPSRRPGGMTARSLRRWPPALPWSRKWRLRARRGGSDPRSRRPGGPLGSSRDVKGGGLRRPQGRRRRPVRRHGWKGVGARRSGPAPAHHRKLRPAAPGEPDAGILSASSRPRCCAAPGPGSKVPVSCAGASPPPRPSSGATRAGCCPGWSPATRAPWTRNWRTP